MDQQTPPYLQSTLHDVQNLNFEDDIATPNITDTHELSSAYLSAAQTSTDAATQAKVHIYFLLAAVLGMHLKVSERSKPYEPMFISYVDGARSAAIDDFQGHVDVLSAVVDHATHPTIKSRFGDVVWILDRKKVQAGIAAVTAYIELVEQLEKSHLEHHDEADSFDFISCQLLRRSLYIILEIGRDRPEADKIRSIIKRLRAMAVKEMKPFSVISFSSLDLDFCISPPGQIASDIESIINTASSNHNIHQSIQLWNLAADAFGKDKNIVDKNRCKTNAAEAMVQEAEKFFLSQGGAMLASHWMGNAIAMLHGIPDTKERRKNLRHRLIDIQAHISDELKTISHPFDIGDVLDKTREYFVGKSLLDQIFILSSLANSPDPNDLARQAREILVETPLSSLFQTSFLDGEGKTIHRAPGSGKFGDENASALAIHVERLDSLRRQQVAAQIDTARQVIEVEHNIPEDAVFALLQNSPFVPPELAATFGKGFSRFFYGDMTSAVYTLVPLLENSLRHVLKQHDYDVSKFDDSTQTQEDRTITSLFQQMREELNSVFGNNITSDIERVFLEHPGPRLRHKIAHGLGYDGTPYSPDSIYACCLILRLCLAPLYPHIEELRKMLCGNYGLL